MLASGLAVPIAAAVGTRARARALDPVKVVIPENSVFVLSWLGAKDAGVFEKHGIDLEVDVRPFAGFLAGLPSKECMATTYSGIDAIEKINQGVDWAIIGGGLTLMEDVIVRNDSLFQKVTDLRGKKFGTFSTGAGSFKAARAAIIDAEGFDIAKDAKLVQLAAPALLKLLANGTVDAMINISSFTIRAASQPDKFRTIFIPNEYWKKKTGYPIVWTAPLVAWRSWVEADPTRAKDFAEATAEFFRWLRQPANLDATVKAHGTLAGVTDPATIKAYKEWLAAKRMFMTRWDRKAVDAQWQFLEMAKARGVLDKVPDEQKYALLVEPEATGKQG